MTHNLFRLLHRALFVITQACLVIVLVAAPTYANTTYAHTAQAKKLLIIDTANHDLYQYQRLTQLAKQAGFTPTVVHFYDDIEPITSYDAVFLFIDPSFMQQHNHPLTQSTIAAVGNFALLPNKIIGLMFTGNTASDPYIIVANKFLKKLNLNLNNSAQQQACLAEALTNYLKTSLTKHIQYGTSLEGPDKDENKPGNEENIFSRITNDGTVEAALLPLHKSFDAIKKKAFPTGLYLNNSEQHNHIFIGKSPALLFAELAENFWVNPIDTNLREQMLTSLQQALHELRELSEGARAHELSLTPKFAQKIAIDLQSRRPNRVQGLPCAWMAPDAYDGDLLEKGIENIVNSNIEILWFSFSPELYLGKNARLAAEQDKQIERVRRITNALKERYAALGKPMPKIFVGVEITGNLRPELVVEPTVDMYGRVYSKIPAPFDVENFWKPEFLDVFDAFTELWNNDIGNGIPISGIFFDFEMYHAQDQAGSYPPISDFSKSSLQRYAQRTGEQISSTGTAMQLATDGKLGSYFAALQAEAFDLGRQFKNHIKARLPQAQIGVYFPNISTDWFYIGLFGGLSTKNDPILLATFNNEIYPHQPWLQKNNIYCQHLAACLLSKFKNPNSFSIIEELNKHHHGIWYNRFSWLHQPYDPKAWWATESTPLDHDLVIREIGKR